MVYVKMVNGAFTICAPPLKKPLFQSEGKCEAIDMKMSFFILMEMINHFHNKGFALRLVLKARVFGTWKWLIRNWRINMTCYDLQTVTLP